MKLIRNRSAAIFPEKPIRNNLSASVFSSNPSMTTLWQHVLWNPFMTTVRRHLFKKPIHKFQSATSFHVMSPVDNIMSCSESCRQHPVMRWVLSATSCHVVSPVGNIMSCNESCRQHHVMQWVLSATSCHATSPVGNIISCNKSCRQHHVV